MKFVSRVDIFETKTIVATDDSIAIDLFEFRSVFTTRYYTTIHQGHSQGEIVGYFSFNAKVKGCGLGCVFQSLTNKACKAIETALWNRY
jgi:hypothetical protein